MSPKQLLKKALPRRQFLRYAAGAAGVLVLVGAGLLVPTRAWADPPTRADFVDFDTHTIVLPGFTWLHRSDDGIAAHFHATDLNVGHVYTFWIVEVESDGFAHGGRVDGTVVNASGVANIHVAAEAGEILGDFHVPGLPIQEGLLADPLGSTFWLVVRDHGPASSDPAALYEQLHTHQTGVPGVTDYAISFQDP